MAKIPLRAYHREIESLIDQGQQDEALAHCDHILRSYPKCLDTYRLMGKALLEAQRFRTPKISSGGCCRPFRMTSWATWA
jgi:hypothetical protein